MSEENKLPEAVDAQDTRTRKTVRLRPNGMPAPQDSPLSDPLNSRNTDTGNLEILDDTQTRKTLKLKPMAPGGTAGPKLNLGGGDDTNTRKTVVLRPASSPVVPVQSSNGMPQTVRLDAAEVAAAVEEKGKIELDDQTRAVPRPAAAAPGGIKLPGVPAAAPATMPSASSAAKVEVDDQTRAVPRPAAAAPGGIKLPGVPSVAPATMPSASSAAKVEVDDQTRAVPRPAAAAPGGIKLPGVPAAAPATVPSASSAAKVEVDDQTRAVPRPAAVPGGVQLPEASAAEDEDDQTVKMKRPPRLAPPPPPAAGDAKATVKMPSRPSVPAAPAAPKPPTAAPAVPKPPTAAPAVPKPPTAAPAPAPVEAAPAPEAAVPKKDDGEISLAPSKRKTENNNEEGGEEAKAETRTPGKIMLDEEEHKPSLFYLILAVATLLFVACTAVLTSVHYLYFEQQLDYTQQIPGLPNAK